MNVYFLQHYDHYRAVASFSWRGEQLINYRGGNSRNLGGRGCHNQGKLLLSSLKFPIFETLWLKREGLPRRAPLATCLSYHDEFLKTITYLDVTGNNMFLHFLWVSLSFWFEMNSKWDIQHKRLSVNKKQWGFLSRRNQLRMQILVYMACVFV